MYQVYQIMPGETIESIARKLGTTVEELQRINGSIMMTPGMNIVVPEQKNNIFNVYRVERGDNLYSISRRFNVNLDTLVRLNGLNETDFIYPGQEILIPDENISVYVTKEGDTIRNIVDALNTDINNLLLQNEDIYLIPDQLIIYKKENTN
ncbi:MAG: LysM peptidoglycan-binding domain-containing protein [Bacilli bacterium]|nr:LysM peptidoglycan-binding domain-containing protein [Bacilli bacterium]MDD4607938.1 LysM peptidoglycan-binding domain-containing protein [Bacilli bacterium]